MNARYPCLFAALLFVLSVSVHADDLKFVTVDTQSDLTAVRSVLDHAFIRIDTKFLVCATLEQSRQLEQQGIKLEALLPDADPDQVLVVYPSLGTPGKSVLLTTLGTAMDIGNGISLLTGSSVSAATLRETAGLKIRALSELSVPFVLEPTLVSVSQSLIDFPSDSVVTRVNQDSINDNVSSLQAFYTRYVYTDSVQRARDWLQNRFLSWGYTDVSFQPCLYLNAYGRWANNVKAVKRGWAEPDQIIVVGAHYDSYSSTAFTHAPGADDNASGTAVVLELARVLANIPLRKSVVFMLFDAEELGLYGSTYAARDFRQNSVKVEAMFNFDMVGFTTDSYWNTNVEAGANKAYMQAMIDAASRVSGIIPVVQPLQGNSDHFPFSQQGFPIGFAIEGDFNTANYHRPSDSTSKMNFPYLTNVVKMAAATVAYTAEAASPIAIDSIIDQGNGQGLRVFWADCRPDYRYTVRFGYMAGSYTHTVDVPAGACSQLITGSFGGRRVYLSVTGTTPAGYGPVYATEASEISQVAPRAPTRFMAEPQPNGVSLTWDRNHEADMDHYDLYRSVGFGGDFLLVRGGLTAPAYLDTSAFRWIRYQYRLTAVDRDGIESAFSSDAFGTKATFDHGILVVDEYTEDSEFNPSPAQHAAFCDSVFGPALRSSTVVDSISRALTRDQAAQYSSIFWFDDDIVTKLLPYSRESLKWYTGFATNLFLGGYETIRQYCAVSPLAPGNLLYDQFMLQSFSVNYPRDFIAAKGQFGWPTIQLDTTRGMRNMGDIPSLVARPGGQVIYTYHSSIADPVRENAPVGIAYDSPVGRRILLAFPLYYMTPASASAFIAAARTYFHESATESPNGDLDGSGYCDVLDLVILIDYLAFSLPFAVGLEAADANGSCGVDIGDVFFIVDYLINGGEAPRSGCTGVSAGK